MCYIYKQRTRKKRLTSSDITKRFNSHSKLRFGVYGNMNIKFVPVDYLKWLVRNITTPRSRRMKALIRYLEEYLGG